MQYVMSLLNALTREFWVTVFIGWAFFPQNTNTLIYCEWNDNVRGTSENLMFLTKISATNLLFSWTVFFFCTFSEDALTTLVGKEEADAGSMDSHRDETQIEAPAYAEENISDRETAKDHQEAEEEVATKDEDTLQVEEGNVTSEDLKEGEKPEGTEPVLLEDETKEQEEEEKMEEKEDGEGVGDGEEDKEEDDIIPEPIPSFDEWKEKMLQKALEEQEKLYGKGKQFLENLPLLPETKNPFTNSSAV